MQSKFLEASSHVKKFWGLLIFSCWFLLAWANIDSKFYLKKQEAGRNKKNRQVANMRKYFLVSLCVNMGCTTIYK